MPRSNGFRIGVDVGGTFTDLVALTPGEKLVTVKTPSTPADPTVAVLTGLEELASRVQTGCREMLESATVVHGTTIGLNTLLTRTGARTALLCTSGFRDILEMRLAYKEDRYDLAKAQPVPLVPRQLRLPVSERIDKDGNVHIPLDVQQVEDACAAIREANVEALAIAFLWSFRNPGHEKLAEEVCRELLPGVYVTASCDVFPEIREYDRVSTTVLNAYIGPRVAAYTDRLEAALRDAGLLRPVRYLQSNGGSATRDEVVRVPVRTLLSGPSAGPAAAQTFAQTTDLICIDMGGTSFDVSVVTDGVVRESRPVDIDSVRMGLPMIDVHTIGGGGSSIAQVNAGLLQVGPSSAGADPGPASYGRGGENATVTDATLALGVYAAAELAPGLILDPTAAERALEQLGRDFGVGAVAAAGAIWQVINLNLADATREVTVSEGRDPRDYAIVAGGGSGPTHACAIAEELQVTRVLVPKVAGTLCAFGALATDLAYESRRSYPSVIGSALRPDDIEAAFGGLESEVRARFDSTEPSAYLARAVELRYRDQLWEIRLDAPQRPVTERAMQSWVERFHERHRELYTYAELESPCELVNLVVRGGVRYELPEIEWTAGGTGDRWSQLPPRVVRLGQWAADGEPVEVPVYDGSIAPAGIALRGPAIIDEQGFVVVVPPQWYCILRGGAYELTREAP